MNAETTAPAIPAATVVVGRDAPDGSGLEVLVLRRATGVSFAGLWSFPGGKLEPGDYRDGYTGAPPASVDEPSYVASCRAAAVRETEEECAIALSPDALVPFSHWLPPTHLPKRFATWFFWADVGPETTVEIDGSEMVEYSWMHPATVLEPTNAITVAPPTWVTLHSLREARTAADAEEMARTRQPPHYATKMAQEAGTTITLWRGDSFYERPDTDLHAPGPRHRLVMPKDGPWSFEHTP